MLPLHPSGVRQQAICGIRLFSFLFPLTPAETESESRDGSLMAPVPPTGAHFFAPDIPFEICKRNNFGPDNHGRLLVGVCDQVPTVTCYFCLAVIEWN